MGQHCYQEILESKDLESRDLDWFFKAAHHIALRVAGSYAQILEDCEAEALLYGWRAYQKGLDRPSVAWSMKNGAVECYRNFRGRRRLPDGSYQLGCKDHMNYMLPLMYENDDGSVEDRKDMPPCEGGVEAYLANESFESLLSVLPKRYALVLCLRYRDDCESKDIAAVIGSTRHRVNAIVKIAMQKLRRAWVSDSSSSDLALLLGGPLVGRDDRVIAVAFEPPKPRKKKGLSKNPRIKKA